MYVRFFRMSSIPSDPIHFAVEIPGAGSYMLGMYTADLGFIFPNVIEHAWKTLDNVLKVLTNQTAGSEWTRYPSTEPQVIEWATTMLSETDVFHIQRLSIPALTPGIRTGEAIH
jgi:hypothetical protein